MKTVSIQKLVALAEESEAHTSTFNESMGEATIRLHQMSFDGATRGTVYNYITAVTDENGSWQLYESGKMGADRKVSLKDAKRILRLN